MDSLSYNLLNSQVKPGKVLQFDYGNTSIKLDGTQREDGKGIVFKGNLYHYDQMSHAQIVNISTDTTVKTDSVNTQDESDFLDGYPFSSAGNNLVAGTNRALNETEKIIAKGVELMLRAEGLITDEKPVDSAPRTKLTTWLETPNGKTA